MTLKLRSFILISFIMVSMTLVAAQQAAQSAEKKETSAVAKDTESKTDVKKDVAVGQTKATPSEQTAVESGDESESEQLFADEEAESEEPSDTEEPTEEASVEEEPAVEEEAEAVTEKEPTGEESAEESTTEEAEPEVEATEEEATEEEVTEEEAEEEEKPKGFVSKWEDIGFDFSDLEAAPLPEEIAKTQPEEKMPEVTELDIDFGDLTNIELQYVQKPKTIKKVPGLPIHLPIIGDVILEPVMIDEEYGYRLISTPGSSINAGILVINNYTMTLVGQSVSFVAEGSLLGRRGKLYLKQIAPSGLVPAVSPPTSPTSLSSMSSTPVTKETKGDVDQMIMSFVYDEKEQPKINITNLGELVLEHTDIVFQKDKPIVVIAKAHIFGVQAEVGLALTTMRVNAFINVQGRVQEKCKDPAFKTTSECQDLRFQDVIPQIAQANASIGKSTIKDLILKINNLFVFKAAQKLTKMPNEELLQGILTATINLQGTDLGANPAIIRKHASKRPVKTTENTSGVSAAVTPTNPLEATLIMNFDKYGYNGTIEAQALYIKDVGTIENPRIETVLSRDAGASIEITGSLIIPLQELPQPLRIDSIEIRLSNEGLRLAGTIPEFTYQQIQLRNLEVTFDTASRDLILKSSKRFGDFELQISLIVTKGSSDDDSKNGLHFTAKLVTTTICAQQAFACKQQALVECKKSEPEKMRLLQEKEKQLEQKESQALSLGAAGKEAEADTAWNEWDALAEEIFKQKTDIAQCVMQAYSKCATEESACTSKQTLARSQATGRVEVEQVRSELRQDGSGKKGTEEKKITIEEISFYPFKDIPGAPSEITSIKLTDIDVGIEMIRDSLGAASGSFYFTGKVHAFGIVVPGTLKFIYGGENKGGMILTVDLGQRTTLEKLFPTELRGSPYNAIYIENAKIKISTITAPNLGATKGIELSGLVPLSGGLADVGKLLGKEGRSFSLGGNFNWSDVRRSSMQIAIVQDTGALTTPEMCKKEFLDCIKNKTTTCDKLTSQEEKDTCKEKIKPECTSDQTACEQGLNEIVRLKNVSIVISFEPSVSVRTTMVFRPPMQKDKPIDLTGAITFGPHQADINAYMTGTWHDAFALKGWELSNLAVKVSQKYGSPLPTSLGGAGRIKIVGSSLANEMEFLGQKTGLTPEELASKPIFQGKTKQEAEKVLQATATSFKKTLSTIDLTMEAAFDGDAALTNIGVEFKTTKVITWTELLVVFFASFFEAMNNKQLVEKLKFIDTLLLKVSNVHGSYAPLRDVIIGAKVIPRGMSLGCTVDIWGKKGNCKMQLHDDGLAGFATFEKIDSPYFKLTGAGEDKLLGTSDDAPIMRVALNILKQEFYIDGQVELIIPQLGTVKSLTRVNIGFDECRFLTQANVFNLFTADLEAKIGNELKDIYIKGKMQQSALKEFEQLLKKAAQSLNDQARKDIEYAKKEVQKLTSSDITAANKKALERATTNVQQKLHELTALKSKLDAAVSTCGK